MQTGPLGVSVTCLRAADASDELAHDYPLARPCACPRRGIIGIFNRSHYEDVLVGRVRKLAPEKEIEQRYEQINAFEKMLAENGTTILKFMLHISKDEQKERLQARLDDRQRTGSSTPATWRTASSGTISRPPTRLMLDRCSTAWAPWHVIPADRKWARNAAIAAIVARNARGDEPAISESLLESGRLPCRMSGYCWMPG